MTTGTTVTATRVDLLRELEEEVGVMLRRVRRIVGERARSVHPELQGSTYLMLGWLDRHGPVRASAMAETFAIDKGAISRQVQHLVDLGLVERTPDPDDGRASLVAVSAVARERMTAVSTQRRAWIDERLDDIPDADLATFVTLLRRYNNALDD